MGSVNPGSVELHDVFMLKRLEEVNFTVKPLQIFGALEEIMQLHLVPRHLDPLILIKRSVPANTTTKTQSDRT